MPGQPNNGVMAPSMSQNIVSNTNYPQQGPGVINNQPKKEMTSSTTQQTTPTSPLPQQPLPINSILTLNGMNFMQTFETVKAPNMNAIQNLAIKQINSLGAQNNIPVTKTNLRKVIKNY